MPGVTHRFPRSVIPLPESVRGNRTSGVSRRRQQKPERNLIILMPCTMQAQIAARAILAESPTEAAGSSSINPIEKSCNEAGIISKPY